MAAEENLSLDADLALAIVVVRAARRYGVPAVEFVSIVVDVNRYNLAVENLQHRRNMNDVKDLLWSSLRLVNYTFVGIEPENVVAMVPDASFRRFKVTGSYLNWVNLFNALEKALVTACDGRSRHERQKILLMYPLLLSRIHDSNSLLQIVVRLQQLAIAGILHLAIIHHQKVGYCSPQLLKEEFGLLAERQNTRVCQNLRLCIKLVDINKEYLRRSSRHSLANANYHECLSLYLRVIQIASEVHPADRSLKNALLSVLLLDSHVSKETYDLINSIAFFEVT